MLLVATEEDCEEVDAVLLPVSCLGIVGICNVLLVLVIGDEMEVDMMPLLTEEEDGRLDR